MARLLLLLSLCLLAAAPAALAQTGGDTGTPPPAAAPAEAPAAAAASAAAAPPAAAPPAAEAAPPEAALLDSDALQQLLGPVALYPDALLAQVLIASAYPLDVVEAARWLEANKAMKPEELQAALDKQPWDPSVKVLVQFPSVLAQLDKNLQWTQALGNAFVNQQADVLAAVQALRAQAKAAGHLDSGEQQIVTVAENDAISIEPADPQKVYVPQYTPAVYQSAPAEAPAAAAQSTVVAPPGSTVVTGGETTVVTPPAPAYPAPAYPAPYSTPYYGAYPAPPAYTGSDVALSGLLGFGTGILVGSLIWNNNNVNWNDQHVYVHSNGDNGWGGGNCGRCNNNVNIGQVNVNNGNIGSGNRVGYNRATTLQGQQPWQPNAQRRAGQTGGYGVGTANRPAGAARPTTGRGYGAGAAGVPTAAALQSSLARGGTGALAPDSAANVQRNASRGAQSLQQAGPAPRQIQAGSGGLTNRQNQPRPSALSAQQTRPQTQARLAQPSTAQNRQQLQARPANQPQAGQNRPQAQTRTASQPTASRPQRSQDAFAMDNGNRERMASQRGQASRTSHPQRAPQAGAIPPPLEGRNGRHR
jgi:hypothetical protein